MIARPSTAPPINPSCATNPPDPFDEEGPLPEDELALVLALALALVVPVAVAVVPDSADGPALATYAVTVVRTWVPLVARLTLASLTRLE